MNTKAITIGVGRASSIKKAYIKLRHGARLHIREGVMEKNTEINYFVCVSLEMTVRVT